MSKFFYFTGEVVQVGDRVRVCLDRMATVSKILIPFSEEAASWEQPKGGVLIDFDDTDRWLNLYLDEDFELVSRASDGEL